MTSRLLFALAVVVAPFSALARSARADDAQTAAAAMQAMTQAGVATGGAPDADGHKKKDDGGFARPLAAPQIIKATGGGKKHAAGKKGADAKASESKYKSREASEENEHVYRFNEKGEPVNVAPKKKAAVKAKPTASSEPDEKDEKIGACTSDEPCPAKKSADADAF